MTTDKTGAPTTITAEADRFTIAVEEEVVDSPNSPSQMANASSPTPKWTTPSKDAVWLRFSSVRRYKPPATPACASSRCARWLPRTSTSTMNSMMSSTQSPTTSNAD